MNIDQIAISLLIILTFILFIKGKWRYDVVSLISLFFLVLTDILLGGKNSKLVLDINQDLFFDWPYQHPLVRCLSLGYPLN